MSKKMLFIMNPVAGRMKAKTELYDILACFCRAGYEPTIQITKNRGHATRLAQNAKNKGYDIVVCSGGDGTARETIIGLLRSGSNVPLGYIPAGTTNDLGNTLGYPADPIEAAKIICRERSSVIDCGAYNDTFFSYVASFGAFTQISYSASQELKNMVGYMAYLIEGLKGFTEIHPVHMKVTADGEELEGDYIFGCVSNATTVAGLLHPDNIDISDGLFELILTKDAKTPNDISKIIVGITTSDFSSDAFIYRKVKEVIFETDAELFWSLDGEKQEGSPVVDIRNLSRVLTVYN